MFGPGQIVTAFNFFYEHLVVSNCRGIAQSNTQTFLTQYGIQTGLMFELRQLKCVQLLDFKFLIFLRSRANRFICEFRVECQMFFGAGTSRFSIANTK